jgi:hypothetical protein
MNGKLTDRDFAIPVHASKLDVLDKLSIDFETRLRKLESYQSSFDAVQFAKDLKELQKYQSEQKGFNAANKLWITLGVTFIISTIVNVLIKLYIK